MKLRISGRYFPVVAVAALLWSGLPADAVAQRAVPRSGGSSSSGGSEPAQGARPRSEGSGSDARAPQTGRTAPADQGSPSPRSSAPPPQVANPRPRGNERVTGLAVPRSGAVPPSNPTNIYYYSYYPWGFGGYGFGGYGLGYYGGGYYGGYYDPWGYGYPRNYRLAYSDDGALRLKIKPKDASVFVDGFYAGRVDDFDGVFQRLHIEPGPHRIEVRADGYEPLTFDVRITPDRTLTYTGELNQQ
jgi:hypothetical protein